LVSNHIVPQTNVSGKQPLSSRPLKEAGLPAAVCNYVPGDIFNLYLRSLRRRQE